MLLLLRQDAYSYLNEFVAAEVRTTIRRIPVEVPAGPQEADRNHAWSIATIYVRSAGRHGQEGRRVLLRSRQKRIDGGRGFTALRDGPHHKRLPAPHIARREYARH